MDSQESKINLTFSKGRVSSNKCIYMIQQGFIFISSVINGHENLPATRSGLSNLHREATDTSRLLVVSRVSNQKVLPWLVSSTGAIRCFDTVSLSQKLSLHRHAKAPILLHVFLWDPALASTIGGSTRFRDQPSLPDKGQFPTNDSDDIGTPQASGAGEVSSSAGSESRLQRDTAGDLSFRFHDFSVSSNWV